MWPTFSAQGWRFLCPIKCIFGPRLLPENNSLWDSKMKTHWFVFSVSMTHWQLSHFLPFLAHSQRSLRSIWLWLFSFFSLFCLLSRQTFFYSACSWSLFVEPVFFPPLSSPSLFPHLCLLFSSPSLLPVYCCGVCVGISRIARKHCISDPWPGSFTPRLLHARHPSPQSERWG